MFCYHYPPAASLHPSIASRLQSALELPSAFAVGPPSLTCKTDVVVVIILGGKVVEPLNKYNWADGSVGPSALGTIKGFKSAGFSPDSAGWGSGRFADPLWDACRALADQPWLLILVSSLGGAFDVSLDLPFLSCSPQPPS